MADRIPTLNDKDYPLLATKLYIPKPRQGLVQRPRLTERLNKATECKLTLISAPAGFGKTTLLSEWLIRSQLPVAWVSLDKGDNDPVYLIKYLIAALQSVEPEIGDAALTLLQSMQQPPLDAIIINLIQEIEDFPNDFVLVFDDYHSIEIPKIHQLVEFLIDRMPSQMHLVVATRVDPGFPLARLRVRNQLNEFRVTDLCFTMEETALFFNQVMELELSNQDIAVLESRTEGWVAGLQLAALSMQGRSDIPGFIKKFAGDNRLIVDYLAEEVLNLQTAHVQNFLLQTSILSRLSEPLCDYVTNRKGSQKTLEDLERANLFLVPLDNKRHWYRYHHLFIDLLRQRLHQKEHGNVSRLHIKASEWFEANGFQEQAIEHALAAKEFERTARLIESYTAARWRGGDQVTLFRWLEQLPDEFKMSKPNLGLYHAQVLFQSGRQESAEKCISQLEKRHVNIPNGKSETPKEPAITALQGRIAAIKAYMATRKGDALGIAKYSQQALDCLSKEDNTWRAIVSISLAIVHELTGDSMAAIEAHSKGAAAAKKAGNVYFYLIERLWLAIVLKNSGRLPEAMDICRQLQNEVNDKTLTFNVAVGHVWGALGEMLYELNALDEAHRYAKKGLALLEQGHDVSHLGWRYACLVKILCSKQDLDSAEKIVPKMEQLMRTSVVPPWVLTQIRAVKARIYLMKGNIGILERWVDECGLKLDEELTILHEAEYIMFARILIAQNRFEDALGLLNRLTGEDEKAGRVLNQIETLILQALVFKNLNKEAESLAALRKALSLAEPGGYTRVFVDEGSHMAELLGKILDAKGKIPRVFVKKLLPEFGLRRIKQSDDDLIEGLSKREMEVLMLIAAGLANKKITEALFISMSTVKTHLRNIYGKLNVHSRTEAIVKAKELDLVK
jgi:LuxR family maltose regulon positive regulatory protein